MAFVASYSGVAPVNRSSRSMAAIVATACFRNSGEIGLVGALGQNPNASTPHSTSRITVNTTFFMGRLFYAKVTGLEGLRDNLKKLEREVRLGLTEAARAGAEIVLRDAVARAPRLTGELARSIQIHIVQKTGNPNIAVAQVGPSKEAFYGRFVEKGTRHSRPEPFLKPALEANRARIIKTMHEKLWKAIRRVAG